MQTTWSGDWLQRLKDRLTKIGFESVRAFLAAREGVTFQALSREFEPAFAPVQIEMAFLRESLEGGRSLEAIAECLARTIIERFPRGWAVGVRSDYRKAGVFIDWTADMLLDVEQPELNEHQLKAIAAALEDTVQPPQGWLPRNGQDALIQQAFKIGLELKNG